MVGLRFNVLDRHAFFQHGLRHSCCLGVVFDQPRATGCAVIRKITYEGCRFSDHVQALRLGRFDDAASLWSWHFAKRKLPTLTNLTPKRCRGNVSKFRLAAPKSHQLTNGRRRAAES